MTSLERDAEHHPGRLRTAYDVKNIFKNHLDSKPIADRPAKDVKRAEIAALLRELIEAKPPKGRTAAKLRSYLRAAYAIAVRAEGDSDAPAIFIEFKVIENPAAETASLAKFTRARDRALTEDELRVYWTRLAAIPQAPLRGALQLALLLGGQRIAQLLRLKRADVNLTAGDLKLRDPKGRRKDVRVHELPITPAAKAILEPLVDAAAAAECGWVFSSDGKSPVDPSTLTHLVRKIAAAMKKAKESPAPFTLSDIRRTAETMMAAMGVSRDVRAQVLSHGLSGVQQVHYDQHGYSSEKRKALAAWARRVSTPRGAGANVYQMARGRR